MENQYLGQNEYRREDMLEETFTKPGDPLYSPIYMGEQKLRGVEPDSTHSPLSGDMGTAQSEDDPYAGETNKLNNNTQPKIIGPAQVNDKDPDTVRNEVENQDGFFSTNDDFFNNEENGSKVTWDKYPQY